MHGHRTPPPKKRRRPNPKRVFIALAVLLVAGTYSTVVLSKPFANLRPSIASTKLSITTPAGDLPWPSYGQGAFSLLDGNVIATHGQQDPLPTASAAKLITTLVVLERKPLAADQSGPTITLTNNDVALYNQYVAAHGSVTPVYSGQQLTERQMLQAILLPSANNLADSLAIWAYGSLDGYYAAANKFLAQKGLTSTHVAGDASGLSPQTTSNASDLVRLGSLVMNTPVLASIVAQKTATIPGVGVVRNVDSLLGINSIVGIKTGNSDQNGGVFVGAANITVSGKPVTIITALSGAGSLAQVLGDSSTLLAAIPKTFNDTNLVTAGTVLGTYTDAKGRSLQAVAASNLSIVMLRGSTVNPTVNIKPISYQAKAGQVVGSVSVPTTTFAGAKQVAIVLKQAPSKPSLSYRLLHP